MPHTLITRKKRQSRSSFFRSLKESVGNDLWDIENGVDYEAGSSNSDSETEGQERQVPLRCHSNVDIITCDSLVQDRTCVSEIPVTGTGVDPVNGSSDEVVTNTGSESSTASDVSFGSPESDASYSSLTDDETVGVPDCYTSKVAKDLKSELRQWAMERNVPFSTVGSLLTILHPWLPTLPLDAKTLLGVTPVVGIAPMGNGHYYYFGIKNFLQRVVERDPRISKLRLQFNVDGLPVFKSSGTECWPILCLIWGSSLPPFVCAVWCGTGKPPLQGYFKDFVPEMKLLLREGYSHNGRLYSVECGVFVCDAPARAFVTGVVGHTAYYGCGKCQQKGRSVGRMTFPQTTARLRTDDSFRQMAQREHHKCVTPLLELGIDMVNAFPLDYCHLICLGVVRRLLFWMMKGKRKVRKRQITDERLNIINQRLGWAQQRWPRDFSRKPRSLKELKRWKATELRQFILYLAPAVLQGDAALPEEYYNLVLYLHVAVTILTREDSLKDLIDIASRALKIFVAKSQSLLGVTFVSYNVHNLIHLAVDCERLGAVDNFSAFPFENELQVLKRAIRGKNKVIQQVVGRIQERANNLTLQPRKVKPATDGIIRNSLHSKGPKYRFTGEFFSKIYWKGRIISLLEGDNVILLKNSEFILAKNFALSNGTPFVIGKKFTKYENLYSTPVQSSDLGIYMGFNVSKRLRSWPLSYIKSKALAVPLKTSGSFALFPLMN